jgi:hypothetical protein
MVFESEPFIDNLEAFTEARVEGAVGMTAAMLVVEVVAIEVLDVATSPQPIIVVGEDVVVVAT